MRSLTLSLVTLASLFVTIRADCYLHSPPGSNNRLNEKSANRANGNRAFDSQNNNRGGYNVGDKTDQAAGGNAANQYQMKYFASGATAKDVSTLIVEWTNQHGCGGNDDTNPSKLNCDVTIQYMIPEPKYDGAYDTAGKFMFRDGTNTNQQNFNANNRNGIDASRVYHEPHEWYKRCDERARNKGLFTADQNVQKDQATHTRQNPGGTRRGLECPEERDYYPYWHPSGWKDIVVLTKRTDRCDFIKKESFNVKPKGECVDDPEAETPEKCGSSWTEFHNYLEITDKNEQQCAAAGSKYEWAVPFLNKVSKTKKCLLKLEAPECKAAPWSRHNHLGNGADDAEPLRYEWTLPHFPSMTQDGEKKPFVLRIRYNISTDDYDIYNTDSKSNGDDKSPVTQNPLVGVGAGSPLQLAINTAQFGRTFQDRSHVSYLVNRPKGINGRIRNLSVRGKRGNIVQTFPAVEYDFMPTKLVMDQDDYVHIHWKGSNTHNNGNPAGDGQAGDAGQGTGGTDRSNIIALLNQNANFPLPIEDERSLFHSMSVHWQAETKKPNAAMTPADIGVKLGSGGYYDCVSGCGATGLDTKAQMNNLLNNAPASFGGMLVKFTKKGKFFYTCSRNNNFTNRSQKGEIVVE